MCIMLCLYRIIIEYQIYNLDIESHHIIHIDNFFIELSSLLAVYNIINTHLYHYNFELSS